MVPLSKLSKRKPSKLIEMPRSYSINKTKISMSGLMSKDRSPKNLKKIQRKPLIITKPKLRPTTEILRKSEMNSMLPLENLAITPDPMDTMLKRTAKVPQSSSGPSV